MLGSPIGYIDIFLNRITMYRLMLYYLIFLVISASIFGLFNYLPYTPKDLLFSSLIALAVGFLVNYFIARIFKAQTNIESVFITGLILVLIMPVGFPNNSWFLVLASFIAMASKYLLVFNKRHIFNPAAFSAVIMSLVFGYSASWWIGSLAMLPFIILGGLLILRKTQKEKMAMVFITVFFLISGLVTFFSNFSIQTVLLTWQTSIFESSLLFFMFVMLIEPLTSPTTKNPQIYFAFIISFIYAATQTGIINLVISPEVILVTGNAFAFLFYPNYRLILNLRNKLKLSKDTYSFIFEKQNNLNFVPGQYMEWTLPHKKADSRGNRRFFTLSSSPTEKEIAITVKFYENSSTYKKKLLNFDNKKNIIASFVSGDFVLPQNLHLPLVFIAGGVGITPFRSMIKYIVDKNFKVDIVLIYLNNNQEEILFLSLFKKAKENGVKTIYFLTSENGHLNKDGIKKLVSDFQKRIFYISGPQPMVRNFEKMLRSIGISKSKIKTDFFPGYAEAK